MAAIFLGFNMVTSGLCFNLVNEMLYVISHCSVGRDSIFKSFPGKEAEYQIQIFMWCLPRGL